MKTNKWWKIVLPTVLIVGAVVAIIFTFAVPAYKPEYKIQFNKRLLENIKMNQAIKESKDTNNYYGFKLPSDIYPDPNSKVITIDLKSYKSSGWNVKNVFISVESENKNLGIKIYLKYLPCDKSEDIDMVNAESYIHNLGNISTVVFLVQSQEIAFFMQKILSEVNDYYISKIYLDMTYSLSCSVRDIFSKDKTSFTIFGGWSNNIDLSCTEGANHVIFGSTDCLSFDRIIGSCGDDYIEVGGGGGKYISGGPGNDTLKSNLSSNLKSSYFYTVLIGGPGTDTIIANDKNDIALQCDE